MPRTMKAFYSDTFVLPLPEQHRIPMAKYRLLRERLVDEGILSAGDLHLPAPIAWDDLPLIHDEAYVDAVVNGTATARPRFSAAIRRSSRSRCMGRKTFRSGIGDLDATFEDGAGDDEYLVALRALLPGVLDAQRPNVVFSLAGADRYQGDRLGRLKLTIDGLRERDRIFFSACSDREQPDVVAMSGGDAPDVDAIVTIHTNTIREAVHSCRSLSAC